MIFVLFFSWLHAIVHKFPNIFAHNSCTVRRYFEKCYSHWAASDYYLRVRLRRPIILQEIVTSKFIVTSKIILIRSGSESYPV